MAMSYRRKVPPAVIALALLMACSGAVPARAQNTDQADEIVVTARRNGIPVWRITSDTATVVLSDDIKAATVSRSCTAASKTGGASQHATTGARPSSCPPSLSP